MKRSKHKLGKKIAVATAAAFLLAPVSLSYTQSGRMTADHRIEITISDPVAHAATVKHYGVDWSKYQGNNGVWGYARDDFSISQVGGYYNGYFVDQGTYGNQVANTIALNRHAHTYIYAQFSGRWQADQMLNHYLPMIQTPKGSIVALDVESGSPDADSILYALKRIQDSGYTAVLYGYKGFLVNHLGYNNLLSISQKYPLWLAEYPDYRVTPEPNYGFFPSFNNVQIFQFTSTYIAGGLDGNVDFSGITENGYKGGFPTKSPVSVDLHAQGNKTRILLRNDEEIETVIRLPDAVNAPLPADSRIGEIMYKINGSTIASYPLLTDDTTVERTFKICLDYVRNRFFGITDIKINQVK